MHHDFELYQKVHKCENCILSFLEISVQRDQILSFVDWQKYAANCRYQRQKIVGSCTWNLFVEIWDSPRMSLVAHRFWSVEFRIFVFVFFKQVHLKTSKQICYTLDLTRPNQWATKDIISLVSHQPQTKFECWTFVLIFFFNSPKRISLIKKKLWPMDMFFSLFWASENAEGIISFTVLEFEFLVENYSDRCTNVLCFWMYANYKLLRLPFVQKPKKLCCHSILYNTVC